MKRYLEYKLHEILVIENGKMNLMKMKYFGPYLLKKSPKYLLIIIKVK